MRVLLDTNVLLSALISPGSSPDLLYRAWRDGRFTLISSEEQMDEFRRVSRYPKLRRYLQPAAAGTMLNEIRQLAVLMTRLPRVEASPDSADNLLLAAAQAGRAEYLVTGDKADLLKLLRFKSVRIISVAEMVALLEH